MDYSGSTTLSWSSSDATSCSASGAWSGDKSISGQETIDSLTTNSTFILTCSSVAGSSSDSIAISVNPPLLGTVTLSWTPPTTNEDGSALTDLAGYKIYYGNVSGTYSEIIDVNAPGIASCLVDDLTPDTYFFSMTAYNASGYESSYSNEVSKTVP